MSPTAWCVHVEARQATQLPAFSYKMMRGFDLDPD